MAGRADIPQIIHNQEQITNASQPRCQAGYSIACKDTVFSLQVDLSTALVELENHRSFPLFYYATPLTPKVSHDIP
jgi:hypothetical protein